jgi:hypothetical protein
MGSAAVMLVALFLMIGVGSAWAEAPTKICVPEGASKPVLSASTKNECPTKSTTKYKTEALPGPAELEALDKILPHLKYVESGVGGKPTIQFSGVNVQVVNGEGKTSAVNGAGNLIIGYDEEPGSQTGSHDLMLGTKQAYTSYGSILGGLGNTASGANTVVLGEANLAEGGQSGVLGGGGNKATGRQAQVLGGSGDLASGVASVVSAGSENTASAQWATVSGGRHNIASGEWSSVSGGGLNVASSGEATVSGGYQNTASGVYANTVSGGYLNTANANDESWVGGGYKNTASGNFSSIFGGKELKTTAAFEAIP